MSVFAAFILEMISVLYNVIGAGSLGFGSWVGQIGHSCRQRLAITATVFRNCVAQALRPVDDSRSSLHASA